MRPSQRISLPALLLAASLGIAPAVQAQLSIATVGVPVVQDFNIGGSTNCTANVPWQNDVTIPACYSDRPTYNYSNGCANIGGLHVAGSGGDMALGGRGSNSTSQVRWGVRFKNNTGVTLSALHIGIRCEQWGYAQSNLANNVTPFAYRTSASPITDVTSGTYTNDPTWNLVSFTAPTGCSGGNSAIDGNSPAYSAYKEGCLNVTLGPGDEIMLRWFDTNDACNDHMLCVDDLTVTGYQAPVLSVDGATTFCAGDSVTLTVTGALDVAWSTGDTTAAITVHEAGTYTAICTQACGTATLSRTVTVIEAPVAAVDPPGPLGLCPGAVHVLTASGGASFLWSTGDTTAAIEADMAGTYSVTVTGECGSDEASVTIAPSAMPIAQVAPQSPVLFCPGTSVTLTASGGDSYLWSNGDETASTTVSADGTWTVTVSNACGSDMASAVTQAIPPPAVSIAAGSTVLCPGGAVVLTASGIGVYLWSTGDTTASITVTAGGMYAVTASNACGSMSEAVTIVGSPLVAAFTAAPLTGRAPLEVTFANSTAPPTATSAWDLGTGQTTEHSPTWTYTGPGVYTVVLTATDPATGCTDTAMATIVVELGTSTLTVPNVFSPNGDGVNDLFLVQQQGLVAFECTLLNRWGQEVGRMTGPEQGWNGRKDGEPLPEGTYYYVVRASGLDGRAYDLSGAVTLVR